MGAHGPNFTGIHHFGFEVEDLDAACDKLEEAQPSGERQISADDGADADAARSRQFRDEMVGPRWRGDRHLAHRLGRHALNHDQGRTYHGGQLHDLHRHDRQRRVAEPDGGDSGGACGPGSWGESRVYGITVHPTEPRTVFAGANGGIFRSRDGGQSFERLDSP